MVSFFINSNMESRYYNGHPGIESRMLAQYLLGDLSAEDQDFLEEQIFIGENYDQLLAVEEDLVEDYLRDQLNTFERERFENFYLASPRRRERVIFTKALFEVLKRNSTEKTAASRSESPSGLSEIFRATSPVLRLSMAAAVLILFAGVTWLIIETLQLRSQSQRLQSQLNEARRQQEQQLAEERAHSKQLMEELQIARSNINHSQPVPPEMMKPPSPIPLLLLTLPNFSRAGGEPKRFVIPRDSHQLQLQLQFPTTDQYRRFIASVQTPEGELIALRRANLIAPGKVTLTLQAGLFRTNDYLLTLKGSTAANELEEIADYQFTIIRK
jgi:hypothetical protein